MIISGLSEWQDERPPSPSYLRVLYLGKMLQDDETLISEYLCKTCSIVSFICTLFCPAFPFTLAFVFLVTSDIIWLHYRIKLGLKLPTYTPQPPTSSGSSTSSPIPTIVHLSVRSYLPLSEGGDPKKKKKKWCNMIGWLPLSFGVPFLLIHLVQ